MSKNKSRYKSKIFSFEMIKYAKKTLLAFNNFLWNIIDTQNGCVGY